MTSQNLFSGKSKIIIKKKIKMSSAENYPARLVLNLFCSWYLFVARILNLQSAGLRHNIL